MPISFIFTLTFNQNKIADFSFLLLSFFLFANFLGGGFLPAEASFLFNFCWNQICQTNRPSFQLLHQKSLQFGHSHGIIGTESNLDLINPFISCDSSSRSPHVPLCGRMFVRPYPSCGFATFGNVWHLLTTVSNFWQLLAAFGSIWQL